MGFFDKIEKLSEKYIEGFFKSKFADHIQPAEIAKILWREMRDNRNVSVSKVYVPNRYTVFLGNEDWKTIDSVRTSLSEELRDFLKKKARDKNYQVVGDVSVTFQLDEELKLGTVTVETAFVEQPSGTSAERDEKEHANIRKDTVLGEPSTKNDEPFNQTIVAAKTNFYGSGEKAVTQETITKLAGPPKKEKAFLILKAGVGEGTKFSLGDQGAIIGRRRTNEIYIDDANVSRSHASIDYSEGCHYITDLGSTNGTFVNGVRINRTKLEPDDLIKIGTTLLEYKVV